MSSISNSLHSHITHLLTESLATHSEHEIPATVKNSARYNSLKLASSSKSVNINQSLAKVNNTVHSNRMHNLNVMHTHLDKLKTLSVSLNSTRGSKKVNNKYESNDNISREKLENSHEDSQELVVDSESHYQIDLLLEVHYYLQNNTALDSYIIFLFFDYIKGTQLISKQSVVVVPFIDGMAGRSVSDISVITSSGDMEKYNLPVFFHIGGYPYTKDWLNIDYQISVYTSLHLHKIRVESGEYVFNGFCLDYNLEDSELITNKTNIKLHMPGFSEVW